MSSGKGTDLGNFVKTSGGKATIFAKQDFKEHAVMGF